MCNKSCIEFGEQNLPEYEVEDAIILEVGSYNVNGSLRALAKERRCRLYIGIDIEAGQGVDIICKAENLLSRFGYNIFDIVICTEMMEHIEDWQRVISNLKGVLKKKGLLILTTRSKGFVIHGYPNDYWRYEVEDMEKIFSDFSAVRIEKDEFEPGVLVKAIKPINFVENDLTDYKLYSIEDERH